MTRRMNGTLVGTVSSVAVICLHFIAITTDVASASPPKPYGIVRGFTRRSRHSPTSDLGANPALPGNRSNGRELNGDDHPKIPDLRLLKAMIESVDRKKVLVGGLAVAGMMEPVQRAVYFWVRAGPIIAHYKLTQWWLDTTHAPKDKRDNVYRKLHDRYCNPAYDIVIHLRGLYVKIGQVLSSRPDFVPRQYIDLFSLAQDSLPQWSFDKVRSIVEQSLRQYHNLEWDDVFESMDEEALGTAAIGQCHRAMLQPGFDFATREVAIKVMEPTAKSRFRDDFGVFRWVCRLAMPGWTPLLNEFERQIMSEFDYRVEAENLNDVRDNLMRSPYRNLAYIPQPFDELCSRHLLVMEMLDGKKMSDSFEDRLADAIGGDRQSARAYIDQKRRGEQGQPSFVLREMCCWCCCCCCYCCFCCCL